MSFSFSISDFDNIVNAKAKNTGAMMDSIGADSSFGLEYYNVKKTESSLNESFEFVVSEPEQYKLQLQIRETFGRNMKINVGGIADHPDFKHLVYGGQMKHYITTMFIDIKGSTKLSLKYPNDLEFIYKFKNAVIKSCIEVIHAFDGHVHRIMGDAVLGFFGSTERHISRPQSILDCLNAASMLTVILEQTIRPWLQTQKADFDVRDFGFRVGCNFGDTEEVLWANYGFGEVGEVSPTGLPVDLAAKLQGLASKNSVMMGEGLLKFFNFPHNFCKIKKVMQNNELVEKEFIYPNYTKADGTLLNYIMRSLNIQKYILGLPIPLSLKESITADIPKHEKIIPNSKFNLFAKLLAPKSNTSFDYYSNSIVIQKESTIIAELVSSNLKLLEKYKVVFYKNNNSGFNDEEILKEYLDEEIDDSQELIGDSRQGITIFKASVKFERDCNFKGLHYIKCEVLNKEDMIVFRDYIYVPIE